MTDWCGSGPGDFRSGCGAVSFSAKLHCDLKLCYILWLGSCSEMRVNPKGCEAIRGRCGTIGKCASARQRELRKTSVFGWCEVSGSIGTEVISARCSKASQARSRLLNSAKCAKVEGFAERRIGSEIFWFSSRSVRFAGFGLQEMKRCYEVVFVGGRE